MAYFRGVVRGPRLAPGVEASGSLRAGLREQSRPDSDHAPGEWGAILGHDRAPEAKTLRNKISLIANDEARVRAWQSALASQWQAGDPDSWATLCVDGHVKVYAGRKGRLPKHFVARQKLCLPASTSYWVNALGGQPLLCLHKPLDPKMVCALEHDVVPALDRRARPG